MMKRIICMMLFVFMTGVVMTARQREQLIILGKDGTKIAYALTDKPKITFTDSDLVVSVNGLTSNYLLINLLGITYSESDVMNISNAKDDFPLFYMNGNKLMFHKIKRDMALFLYKIDGSLVFKKRISKDSDTTISLSSIESGIYVLQINGTVFKIIKK